MAIEHDRTIVNGLINWYYIYIAIFGFYPTV